MLRSTGVEVLLPTPHPPAGSADDGGRISSAVVIALDALSRPVVLDISFSQTLLLSSSLVSRASSNKVEGFFELLEALSGPVGI